MTRTILIPTELVLAGTRLTDGEFRAYAVMASYDRSLGYDAIAADMGCSTDKAQRAVAGLVQKGYVEKRRRGLGRTNTYVLRVPPDADEDSADRDRTELEHAALLANDIDELAAMADALRTTFDLDGDEDEDELAYIGEENEQAIREHHFLRDVVRGLRDLLQEHDVETINDLPQDEVGRLVDATAARLGLSAEVGRLTRLGMKGARPS